AGAEEADETEGVELLAELSAAAVQGRTALGERAGERDQRPGRGTRNEPFAKGPLRAELDGYSLHAAVRVEGRDRDRLEHLCRYAGRPAIAAERLVDLEDGRVAYTLKRRWRDGSGEPMVWQATDRRTCAELDCSSFKEPPTLPIRTYRCPGCGLLRDYAFAHADWHVWDKEEKDQREATG
ncbi:MAG: transposase, partial [Planctomycetes bacterium]|nr:transposase [Planctomycetota bacterium]